MKDQRTIVARATPLGIGGVAIVRLSGPAAVEVSNRFCRPDGFMSIAEVPTRYMSLASVHVGDVVLDRCLLVRFKGPKSFSGEDVVEFHLHGTTAICDRVIELALDAGALLAEPGEFTRQAFLNGKMDLTQVEALADIIATESEQALILAQRQLHGEFKRRLDLFRDRVIHVLARIELELDFAEEGYSFASDQEVGSLVGEVRNFAMELIADQRRSRYLRNGPRILLLGKPNAGKSSLFNALVGYNRAIVSPEAGTTRDYLEEKVSYSGIVFHFVDTAGLRHTEDRVESSGVERARQLTEVCDHILYLADSTAQDLTDEIDAARLIAAANPDVDSTLVLTKADISRMYIEDCLSISVFDRCSIEALMSHLISRFGLIRTERLALVNQRQVSLLQEIVALIDEIDSPGAFMTEVLSLQLRALLRPLSELTGAIVNDDILNQIFSSFCIGK